MARARGSNAALAAVFESVYGTAPASGYKKLPFASTTLGEEQPLLENELLGFGRDPLAPVKDAITADGNVVIPMDLEALGFWLKATFGAPNTTGTGPYTHVYRSGGSSLPSLSIEKQLPDVPLYEMFSGCMVNTLSWTMQRSGLLTATVGLVAQGKDDATSTAAGTPTEYTLDRFGHFHGAITRDGAALGNIVSAEINFSNNLDRIETIRSDGKIDGADPGMCSLSGRITARFAATTLIDQASAGDPCELEFTHTITANEKFTFTAHAVYLPKPRIPVDGPQGVQVTYEFQGAKAASPAYLCTAELINSVASY